eukprot:TRINITY_DN8110_c0_g1_i1.p1 TRINITY_DN8110_c0_g1~~TRINITY_DN8110_c0_g1_i1.p1  ORF type:complete len:1639 (+),score=355.76 TRINITY_DN8110_c0_g1_i1:119-5035(+)
MVRKRAVRASGANAPTDDRTFLQWSPLPADLESSLTDVVRERGTVKQVTPTVAFIKRHGASGRVVVFMRDVEEDQRFQVDDEVEFATLPSQLAADSDERAVYVKLLPSVALAGLTSASRVPDVRLKGVVKSLRDHFGFIGNVEGRSEEFFFQRGKLNIQEGSLVEFAIVPDAKRPGSFRAADVAVLSRPAPALALQSPPAVTSAAVDDDMLFRPAWMRSAADKASPPSATVSAGRGTGRHRDAVASDSGRGRGRGGSGRGRGSPVAAAAPQSPAQVNSVTRSRGEYSSFTDKRQMISWLQKRDTEDAQQVVLSLSKFMSPLEDLLNRTTQLPSQCASMLLKVLARSDLRRSLLKERTGQIYDAVNKSAFIRHQLESFIAEAPSFKFASGPSEQSALFGNVAAVLQELMNRYPGPYDHLPLQVLHRTAQRVNLPYTLPDLIEDLLERQRFAGSQPVPAAPVEQPAGSAKQLDVQQSNSDFRSLPIFPTAEEILNEKPPRLLPNKIDGPYENMHTYLDTHFRLLREDCLYPLRQGIHAHIRGEQQRDVRVYSNVRIHGVQCTRRGIVYRVSFQVDRPIMWDRTKRLLYGSLLCLSPDNFKHTLLWATVENRDVDLLTSKRQIDLRFPTGFDERLSRDTVYTMAESATTYFEAYRHVLQALQNIDIHNFPFQDYLLRLRTQIAPPSYIEPQRDAYVMTTAFPDMETTMGRSKINVLQEWPQIPSSMDQSQMEALKQSVTRELALIQGPPGTGKTFVGLKTMRCLLTNTESRRKGPILVVCYTNHALDQFLEGVFQVTDNLVRIGSRSKSEILKKANLRELMYERKDGDQRRLQKSINERQAQLTKQVEHCVAQLKRHTLSLEEIETIASAQQFESLRSGPKLEADFVQSGAPSDLVKLWLPKKAAQKKVRADATAKHPEHQSLSAVIDRWWKANELVAVSSRTSTMTRSEVYHLFMDFVARSNIVLAPPHADTFVDHFCRYLKTNGIPVDYVKPQAGPMYRAAYATEARHFAGIITNVSRESTDTTVVNEPVEPSTRGGLWTSSAGDDDIADQELQSDENIVLQMQYERMVDMDAERSGLVMELDDELSTTAQVLSDDDELLLVDDVWLLKDNDRLRLHDHWLAVFQREVSQQLQGICQIYERVCNDRAELEESQQLAILSRATVVGMTTTATAKYQKLVAALDPEIVIVEEAAEVLESHILAAIRPSTKHLILIGDHEQLRPSTAVYHLATRYHLDVSLFERLVMNKVEHITLLRQRRMRPEISSLIKPLYPMLRDHPDVLTHPHVKGVSCDVFFLDHNMDETTDSDTCSRSNMHEALMTTQLCGYLLRQGYAPTSITVLTAYCGQILLLKKTFREAGLTSVQLCSIDQYQGEENHIIVLSLVRSNTQGNIGFLNVSNRVCVALSRAKDGLFILGNATLLQRRSELWRVILSGLAEAGQTGKQLELRCQKHPDKATCVSREADFKNCQDGGCDVPCSDILQCGHACPLRCHPFSHDDVKCMQRCTKVLHCKHSCSKRCHEVCEPCEVTVDKEMQCGHVMRLACGVDENTVMCERPCERVLRCKHLCPKMCGERCATFCAALEKRGLPCGHIAQMACGQNIDDYICVSKCEFVHACGHQCSGSCGRCRRRKHAACVARCQN